MEPSERSDVLIREAYERLERDPSTASAMLGDVYERMAVRRRRRLQVRAGLGVVALGCTVALGFALSGGSPRDGDSAPIAGTDQGSVAPTVAPPVVSADGRREALEPAEVSCDEIPLSGDTLELLSARADTADGAVSLQFMGDLDRLAPGTVIDFPLADDLSGTSALPQFAQVFVFMEEAGRRAGAAGAGAAGAGPAGAGDREASTTEAGTSGTVEVVSASCGADPHVELVMDLSVGGENGGGPIDVTGTVR